MSFAFILHRSPLLSMAGSSRIIVGGGQKVLDTHLGSGSSRIAAYRMGIDFYGCEIDKTYFDASQKRFLKECLGVEVINGRTVTQQSLF